MNDALLQSSTLALVLHGLSAACLLVAAVMAIVANGLNKGAKANIAWGLMAGGFLLLALVEASKAAIQSGLPNLARWEDPLSTLGAALVAAGAIVWRGLIAGMRK